jgi:hypothetical protein
LYEQLFPLIEKLASCFAHVEGRIWKEHAPGARWNQESAEKFITFARYLFQIGTDEEELPAGLVLQQKLMRLGFGKRNHVRRARRAAHPGVGVNLTENRIRPKVSTLAGPRRPGNHRLGGNEVMGSMLAMREIEAADALLTAEDVALKLRVSKDVSVRVWPYRHKRLRGRRFVCERCD